MQYLGGKKKIAKYIANYIKETRPYVGHYYEMFCGMCSVGIQINAKYKHFSDGFLPTISFLKAVKDVNFEFPNIVTKEEYDELKNAWKKANKSKDKVELGKLESNPLLAYYGFGKSFGAKWMGGYTESVKIEATLNWIKKIRQNGIFNNAEFSHGDYRNVRPKNALIYLDPPYKDTTQLEQQEEVFDSNAFYEYCLALRQDNNEVFISEYNMPSNLFTMVAEYEIKQTVSYQQTKASIKYERLFIVK